MKLLLLDSYDDERVAYLTERLGPQWSIATGSHRQDPSILAEQLSDADAAVTQYWSQDTPPAPKLKLIQLPGAGFDAIDFSAVPEGCAVCNVFEHEIGIAEYIVHALLHVEIRLSEMDKNLRTGQWLDGFVSGAPYHGELYGKRAGFIGYGHIAREAAKRLRAFGMAVSARTRSPSKVDDWVDDVGSMDELDTMLETARYVIVTCPLNDDTRGLIDHRRLALMGPRSVLINVARGPIVDEAALYRALSERQIEHAIIDTWYQYPDPMAGLDNHCPPSQFPFASLDNVTMSSHASGWTDALFNRRFAVIASNVERLASGDTLTNVLKESGTSPSV